jgi:hypothetical protein
MKLVIGTQYRENYGSESEPYWKFKGGSTYVVENITAGQRERIEREGIPTLKSLIEYSGPMTEEYILDYSIVEDSAPIGEPWETPTVCVYSDGAWHASTETLNDEYGYLRSDIGRKLEIYTMLPEGGRGDYTVEYYDRAGKIMILDRLTPA